MWAPSRCNWLAGRVLSWGMFKLLELEIPFDANHQKMTLEIAASICAKGLEIPIISSWNDEMHYSWLTIHG